MDIGFVGLGRMGSAMAARLIAAGHVVTVWNRSRAAVDALVAQGAIAAATPADAARHEVVHTMLADDASLLAVLDAGLRDAMPPGAVHVSHETISVALARALTDSHRGGGREHVAAPVFGRPDAVAAGRLHVLAAGAPRAIDRVRPLLEALGKRVWPLGDPPERANVVKLGGNFLIASAIEAMAEASALTRAHGVDASDFLGLLTATLFAAPVYQGYGALIAERRYSPAGFALQLGHKDVGLVLAAADAARVPMPVGGVLRDAFLDALAHGQGDLDWASLADVAARRAGLGDGTTR